MDTSKLIPISYVKKITPLAVGDKVIHASDTMVSTIFDIETWNEDKNDDGWFVVSFADRLNEGAQPVDGDVIVDICNRHGSIHTDDADTINWDNSTRVIDIKSWKPNHAAMLKQWQAEQLELKMAEKLSPSNSEPHPDDIEAWSAKDAYVPHGGVPSKEQVKLISHADMVAKFASPQINNVMTEKADGMHYDAFISAGWTHQGLIDNGYLFDFIGDKPTFTQAMKDNCELPPIGAHVKYLCDVMSIGSEYVFHGKSINDFLIIESCDARKLLIKVKYESVAPIQTAEEKLREAIYAQIATPQIGDADLIPLIDDLLAKFTITFKR
jgi:hypothetical protein